MVSAIVLMHIERDLIGKVAEQLAEIDGVSEVYSVAGEYVAIMWGVMTEGISTVRIQP